MTDNLFPSFFALNGRRPVAGQDYDPDAALCQDDHDFFTGTGQYSDTAPVIYCDNCRTIIDEPGLCRTCQAVADAAAEPLYPDALTDDADPYQYGWEDDSADPFGDW